VEATQELERLGRHGPVPSARATADARRTA
jgi:hypothetical protein